MGQASCSTGVGGFHTPEFVSHRDSFVLGKIKENNLPQPVTFRGVSVYSLLGFLTGSICNIWNILVCFCAGAPEGLWQCWGGSSAAPAIPGGKSLIPGEPQQHPHTQLLLWLRTLSFCILKKKKNKQKTKTNTKPQTIYEDQFFCHFFIYFIKN